MATMIPTDPEEFGTEGERAFYKFFEGEAKPRWLDRYFASWPQARAGSRVKQDRM